jgi:hypothetical protein
MADEIKSIEVQNQELVDAIVRAGEGELKFASEASSNMLRRKLRENGFSRLILDYKPATDAILTRLPNTELPVVIEEMEPLSPGAKSIAFNDTADTTFYRGDDFIVNFSKITTPEFTKNVEELRKYRSDLRGVVTDNSFKDMQKEEDSRWIKTHDRIIGSVSGVGESGLQQNFEINGKITRDSYKDILSFLEDRELMNGSFLMNRKTAKAFLGWDRSEIGGDLAEKLLKDGLSALEQGIIFGVKHIFTMKRDLVPDGVIYQYAEPNYLGRAYVLQEPTMYVEKKKDILRFSAMEKIGVTFANVAALNRVRYTG